MDGGLDYPDLMARLEIPYKAKKGISTKGKFKYRPHRTLTGVLNFDKTKVTQLADGTFKISGKGRIEGEDGLPVLANGQILLHIGQISLPVPAANVRFRLLNTSRKFKFVAKGIPDPGMPKAEADAPLAYKMPFQFEIPTVDGLEFYESRIELKRTKPTLAKWKR